MSIERKGLAPRLAEFGLENNCRQLADEGYTVVQDVAPPPGPSPLFCRMVLDLDA